jgi:hypothetical protein
MYWSLFGVLGLPQADHPSTLTPTVGEVLPLLENLYRHVYVWIDSRQCIC